MLIKATLKKHSYIILTQLCVSFLIFSLIPVATDQHRSFYFLLHGYFCCDSLCSLASSKDKGRISTAAKKEERRRNMEEERNGAGMWRGIYTVCAGGLYMKYFCSHSLLLFFSFFSLKSSTSQQTLRVLHKTVCVCQRIKVMWKSFCLSLSLSPHPHPLSQLPMRLSKWVCTSRNNLMKRIKVMQQIKIVCRNVRVCVCVYGALS